VSSILRHLHEKATMTRQTLSLHIDIDTGLLEWAVGGKQKREKLLSLSSVKTHSKGTLKNGELTLLFGPRGLNEHVWVELENGDKPLTVTFNPISGRTKVF
jgi:hypothetical protein